MIRKRFKLFVETLRQLRRIDYIHRCGLLLLWEYTLFCFFFLFIPKRIKKKTPPIRGLVLKHVLYVCVYSASRGPLGGWTLKADKVFLCSKLWKWRKTNKNINKFQRTLRKIIFRFGWTRIVGVIFWGRHYARVSFRITQIATRKKIKVN